MVIRKPKTEIFQQLSDAGFSLIPVKGKDAFEKNWTEACLKKRNFDPAKFNGNNAGIACGPASGVLVLDPDHLPKFQKYCQDNGWDLPRTRKHRTGSGNCHLLYKYPQDGKKYGNRGIKDPEGEINPKTGKVWTIFDVRGVGGQVVAPGSIHPDTGGYYEIEDDHPIVDAPECLLRLYDEPEFTEGGERPTEANQSLTSWDGDVDCLEIDQEDIDLIKNGAAPGVRSDKLFRCLKVLIKAGLTDNQIIQVLRRHPNGIAAKWLKDKRGKVNWILAEIRRARQKKTESKPKPTASDKPKHLDIARAVIAAFGAENILESQGSIWVWRDGVWKKIDIREVKQKVHAIAGDLPSFSLSKSSVESICDLVRTEVYRPDHKSDVNYRIINCLNGELHWIDERWQLKPHCRENYRTTQIPVVYNAKALAPRFQSALDEDFRDDPDKEEKKQIVLEMIGYTLLATCAYEKFFILIGPGANGKSVLMDTAAALVGPEHVAAVQPSQFENRFQRAHLQGKLVNLVSEIAEGHEIADAQLKAIVSGELTTAEHKLQKPFEFRPFATCIFGTNHMPHTRDFSEALFRRAIILTFNRKFEEHEQDKHLREKLREELPGILNLALMGIAGVLRRRGFTQAASVEERKKEWRVDCDQVAQFVEDRCDLGADFFETSYTLFHAYEDWTKEAGVRKALNRKNFTQRLTKLGLEPDRGTGGVRLISGVKVRD